jgi:Outer membrane protein beta-barrel domain
MKRVGMIALVFVFCFTAFASAETMEIDKGTIMIGGMSTGGLFFGSHTITPEKGDDIEVDSTAFAVLGYGGYFVMDQLAIGPIVGIGYGKAEVDNQGSDITATLKAWDIGVQGIYIYPLSKKKTWAPFGALALEYMSGEVEYEVEVGNTTNKTTTDMSGWSATPRGGIQFFLHQRISLDLSIFIKYISGSGSVDAGGTSADMDVKSMNYGVLLGLNGFLK